MEDAEWQRRNRSRQREMERVAQTKARKQAGPAAPPNGVRSAFGLPVLRRGSGDPPPVATPPVSPERRVEMAGPRRTITAPIGFRNFWGFGGGGSQKPHPPEAARRQSEDFSWRGPASAPPSVGPPKQEQDPQSSGPPAAALRPAGPRLTGQRSVSGALTIVGPDGVPVAVKPPRGSLQLDWDRGTLEAGRSKSSALALFTPWRGSMSEAEGPDSALGLRDKGLMLSACRTYEEVYPTTFVRSLNTF